MKENQMSEEWQVECEKVLGLRVSGLRRIITGKRNYWSVQVGGRWSDRMTTSDLMSQDGWRRICVNDFNVITNDMDRKQLNCLLRSLLANVIEVNG